MSKDKLQTQIITISNSKTNQFFFSTDHCQGLSDRVFYSFNTGKLWVKDIIERRQLSDQEVLLCNNWVPCTAYLPMYVAPRPSVPDGIITDIKTYVNIFHHREMLIANPDPRYEPWSKHE